MQAPKPVLRLGDTVHLIGSTILGMVYGIESHADLYGRFWVNVTVMDSLGHETVFSGRFSENLIKYEEGDDDELDND
jgi:hypothetical protein